MEFEWDVAKAESNLGKHGVSFEEAVTVFGDPLEMTVQDESQTELRFVSLGRSEHGRLLVVVYTEREERMRIISAREATSKERRQYGSAN